MAFDSQPRVTIVMTARERYGLTVDAIDGILRHTPGPYRLIYVDAQAPEWLREALAPYQARGDLEVLRSDDGLWPHVARRNVLPGVASEYVVFIDNDVLVAPGWLEAMVRCADETGAGIVGPLYLWGGGAAPVRVHMAGGQLTRHEAEGGRVLGEAHLLVNADPAEVAPDLKRQPCDFVEFHCMLVRTALLDGGALLDPDIHCVHEHIDLSLALEARGARTWFEPAAVVNYQAFAPFALSDLPLYRVRWSVAAAEHSIAAFSAKWGVLDDERSFGAVREFVRGHMARLDPMRPNHPPQPDRDQPMRAEELCQTRSALLDLAVARGYGRSTSSASSSMPTASRR
jgi:glycosyltransferase involved in cell wall biosynthesis